MGTSSHAGMPGRRAPEVQARASTLDGLDRETQESAPRPRVESFNTFSVPAEGEPVSRPKEEKWILGDFSDTFTTASGSDTDTNLALLPRGEFLGTLSQGIARALVAPWPTDAYGAPL